MAARVGLRVAVTERGHLVVLSDFGISNIMIRELLQQTVNDQFL